MLYFTFGILWTIYVFIKRKKIKPSQQDHWFPVALFSLLLWPLFAYFAYERGLIQDDFKPKKESNDPSIGY